VRVALQRQFMIRKPINTITDVDLKCFVAKFMYIRGGLYYRLLSRTACIARLKKYRESERYWTPKAMLRLLLKVRHNRSLANAETDKGGKTPEKDAI
jgi:hypothetical protein